MNQLMLVGRVVSIVDGEVSGKKFSQIKLAVTRQYKNEEGIYDTDIIPILLPYGSMASNTKQYCNKGDVVGIRGRIQSDILANKSLKVSIIADKVTFLSAKDIIKNDDEDDS